ncbi:hypothetical protein DMUE_3755 [Dictyocoela muelleri]|nr:hypothetical protein DMUE_3755 [Dictyocoela muelleri]
MSEMNVTKIKDIIRNIQGVEKLLLEKEYSLNDRNKYYKDKNNNNENNYKRNIYKGKNLNNSTSKFNKNYNKDNNLSEYKNSYIKYDYNTNSKYCDLHKTKNHSNDQCRVQNFRENKSNNILKLNKLNSKETTLSNILLNVKIKGKNHEVLIDSGATNNFIKKYLVRKHKLDIIISD